MVKDSLSDVIVPEGISKEEVMAICANIIIISGIQAAEL